MLSWSKNMRSTCILTDDKSAQTWRPVRLLCESTRVSWKKKINVSADRMKTIRVKPTRKPAASPITSCETAWMIPEALEISRWIHSSPQRHIHFYGGQNKRAAHTAHSYSALSFSLSTVWFQMEIFLFVSFWVLGNIRALTHSRTKHQNPSSLETVGHLNIMKLDSDWSVCRSASRSSRNCMIDGRLSDLLHRRSSLSKIMFIYQYFTRMCCGWTTAVSPQTPPIWRRTSWITNHC